METWILKSIFMIFWVATWIIRYPFNREQKKNTITINQKTTEEKLLLGGAFLGMGLIPVIHILTSVFAFADYTQPLIFNIVGIIITIPALWLFYRSHRDLGKNWSPSLEIREGHHIVDGGVYKYIRHPMYSAIWLWVIVQACLLPNWVAGFSGIVGFGFLYFLRVGKEEVMMQQQFGEQYTAYKQKTKRLIPFLV
ncbi:MAG: isoprenylcysteine carboxylmethyltransferase family protein [Chloroflexia bacterium]|nr:isoprenylcysteine carboxylmethyltransferase family protein [Chloroflexia bacterium]